METVPPRIAAHSFTLKLQLMGWHVHDLSKLLHTRGYALEGLRGDYQGNPHLGFEFGSGCPPTHLLLILEKRLSL